jgi:hypothetical protein
MKKERMGIEEGTLNSRRGMSLSQNVIGRSEKAHPFHTARLDRMSLEDALTKSKEIITDFENYLQGTPKSFVTLVCERYLKRFPSSPESALEIVEMYTGKVNRYHALLTKEQSEILNLVGLDKEYYEVDKLVKQVLEVILWLDDIYGAALGSQSVGEMYRQNKFEFMQ